jgi:uncharacterized protein YrrD
MNMQIREGAPVFTADGEQIGTIYRVVVEPHTKAVTHLVVRKGFLFLEDKVVPLSLVESATEDNVTLSQDANDLDKLPKFEEPHYIAAELESDLESEPESEPGSLPWAGPVYPYPPIGLPQTPTGYGAYAMPQYVVRTKRNIPEDTVALETGATVFASDDEKVGNVERIFTDPATDRATHLLISEGLFLKEKKMIPTEWVNHVLEDEIHLSVSSKYMEGLPEYEPED